MEYDKDEVDATILALLWLTSWEEEGPTEELRRTWKGHDFTHMNRLHEKGYISDPCSKAKSVMLTDKGRKRAEALFRERFGEATDDVDDA